MRIKALLLLASLAATPAAAQNTQAPTVITVPQQNFSLQPGTPTPTPSPTAEPAPPPVTPTIATPTPAPRPTPTARPKPRAAPTSAAPTPQPIVEAPPVITPPPAPAAAPSPVVTPVAQPAPGNGYGAWPWLLGALVLAGLAYLGWRRWTAVSEPVADEEYAPEAAPPPPAPPPADTPALAVDFRPISFRTQGPDAVIAFELTIANASDRPVEAIRTLVAFTTAGPDIAGQVAAFNANAPMSPASAPFDLAPGASERLGGELLLAGDAMFVTEKGDRALIVPVALVNVRWRAGLSIRSRGENFMIGVGDGGAAKLGPVRVDRASHVHSRLAARRFDVPAA